MVWVTIYSVNPVGRYQWIIVAPVMAKFRVWPYAWIPMNSKGMTTSRG